MSVGMELLTQRLKEGSIDLTSSLVERALWNDGTRRLIMDYLLKRMETQVNDDPHRPWQVVRDKMDAARAMTHAINRAIERRQISRHVLRRLLRTLVSEVLLGGGQSAREARQRFAQRHDGGYPPVTMVISPTKTCNLHCKGCYASSDTSREYLPWEVMERIVTEAKQLWGLRFFTISGGEPLVYRSDGKTLLDLVAQNDDCFFMMYTNGTLIDEKMAQRMAELGNLIPAISVEGFEARTDERRGKGVFQRILQAMANLRQAGVPFGISLTATRQNAEELLSDEFLDFFFEQQQALFGWLFQYMPIGRGYTLDMLVTPEQRLWMWQRTWYLIREKKMMLLDFWNCGTLSDGCIAAGRPEGYLYIDWNGKVMPCVFVPYSPANIMEVYRRGGTLDDIYDLPYFRAIRQWQKDYAHGKGCSCERGNWLIPCSLRDHYAMGRSLIDRYRPEPEDEAASAILQDPEYYRGMVEYNEALRRVFEPVWRREYLQAESHAPVQHV
ncbi:MAG: radical SAM protein [Armatimonadota bacterium]